MLKNGPDKLSYRRKVWLCNQFSPVTQACPTLCDSMACSTPGIPVHHQLLEPAQIHVHRVGDAIQPSRPLSSTSPAFNLSQYQGLFQWVSSSHQVAKVLEFQLQHHSFQCVFRVDFSWCHSVSPSCPTLCDPMDCSMPGFPVIQYLPEFSLTHVH